LKGAGGEEENEVLIKAHFDNDVEQNLSPSKLRDRPISSALTDMDLSSPYRKVMIPTVI
jgi:hypothetical protein